MTVIDIVNPATGEKLGAVPEKTKEEIQHAVTAARKAFPAWRDTPIAERLAYIKSLREYIVSHADELAGKIAADTGKVHLEALVADIFPAVDLMKHYEKHAEAILKPKRVKTPITLFGRKSQVQYRPMGVIAVISPWNYPFQLAMAPTISALIAGNVVLVKPSEVTPLTGLIMEQAFQAVSFPDGVVQFLHGGREVGQELVSSKPDKIFFTGSVATGKKIMAAAAEHLIPVELELGGKDPMIVFADADLDRAANGAIWGAFTNAGQTCMAVERVYVEESVHDIFVQKVVEKTEKLRVGAGEGMDVGSMTFPQQINIVEDHIADAVAKGAKILCGGKRISEKTLHFEPTVLINVDHTMRIMTEETFGPVLPIMKFTAEEEALRLANDSVYGLNGSVWTRSMDKAKRVADRMESGNVCINDVMINMANPFLPFGGVKASGMGRYHGEEGLLAFSHITSVITHPGTKKNEINWYPYSTDQLEAFRTLIQSLYGAKFRISVKQLGNLMKEFFR